MKEHMGRTPGTRGHPHPQDPEEPAASTAAGPQTADRPGETGVAYYVYAVAQARNSEGYEAASLIDGGRSRVYGLRYRDVVAIVSPVPLAEFGPGVLEANLRDAAWARVRVLAHQEVLAGLLSRYTLVPFKFCTLYRSEDSVLEMLDRHYQGFAENLARLEGATELGVKVYCDRRALAERVRETSKALKPLREGISRMSEGAAYFLKKKLEQAAEQEAEQVMDACTRESHERLAGRAREAVANPIQPPEVHGRGVEMMLNGAYLVDDDGLEDFRVALASLDETYAPLGFSYELTGPWPPYNFAAVVFEEPSGDRAGT